LLFRDVEGEIEDEGIEVEDKRLVEEPDVNGEDKD